MTQRAMLALLVSIGVSCASGERAATPEPTVATEAPVTSEPTVEPTEAPAPPTEAPAAPVATEAPAPQAENCDPSYPDFCIPPPPPDLDCADVQGDNFRVQGSDPHGFDADGDGVGCES